MELFLSKQNFAFFTNEFNTKKMIEVCCALIMSNDKILAVQRGPESNHPYLWEFPGGKIQEDESAEQCIIREIEEELSVRINVLFQLEPIEFDYGIKQIRLFPFVCKITSGEIILNEHLAQHWFSFGEWETIDWLDADRKLVLRNQETLKSLR
jgi:8-oxo-dGTP diphosphatase